MPIPAAIVTGAKILAPFALSALFGRKGGGNKYRDQALRLLNYGRLSPEDYALADLQKRESIQSIADVARESRIGTQRRYDTRRLDLSPALETSLARIGEIETTGRSRATEAAQRALQMLRLKKMGMATGLLGQSGGYADLAQSEFANSLLGFFPSIIDSLNKLGAGATSGGDVLPGAEPRPTRPKS